MTNEATPGNVRLNDQFGPLPGQAGWALEMHGSLVLFASNAEKAAGQSPGVNTALFTAEQMHFYAAESVAAERERRVAAEDEFTEDNVPTLSSFLAECFEKTQRWQFGKPCGVNDCTRKHDALVECEAYLGRKAVDPELTALYGLVRAALGEA